MKTRGDLSNNQGSEIRFWCKDKLLDGHNIKNADLALTPTPDSYDKDGVFSGCCVVYDGIRPDSISSMFKFATPQ